MFPTKTAQATIEEFYEGAQQQYSRRLKIAGGWWAT
jgi:hypothetical protein